MNIEIQKTYTDNEIIEIWRGLENIPTDSEKETIESDYFIWEKGTAINIIWSWFNKNYSEGLMTLFEDSTFTE